MDVQAAVARQPQDLARQQQPVSDHHEDLGCPGLERDASGGTPERRGLRERQAAGERSRLHRSERELAAPALGPVRLGEHPDDLVVGAQRLQHRQRELRRAGKGDAQLQYARRAPPLLAGAPAARSLRSLSSFLRMRSRFISER